MIFNKHSDIQGNHAFLSASKYHWVRYDESKVAESYSKFLATRKGTILHDFAAQCITLRQRLPRSKKTLNSYVNDAIGFRMIPEQPLFFTDNCFGTADAIVFNNGLLRIHDYKSGITPTHMEQLEVYTSLFCLEYVIEPSDIDIELRIYQNDEIVVHIPEKDDIRYICDKMVKFDSIINKIKVEEGLM